METRLLSVEEIEQILKNGDVAQLVWVEETSDFEFREYSYVTMVGNDSSKNKSKLELARDVTAIANSGGGLICIGLKPIAKETEKKEYVGAVTGVKKEHIQIGSWKDILAEMVVPGFPRSSIEYAYSGANDEVFWMKIRDAKETGSFPFVLVKDQWEPSETQQVKGKVFGYYYRDEAQNVWMTGEKMQQYIATGIATAQDGGASPSIEGLQAQLQNISTKLDNLIGNPATSNELRTEKELEEKNKKMIEYATSKLGGYSGYFYIHAIPTKAARIPNFWHQGEGSVYRALKDPPRLREKMGWDLSVADSEYPTSTGDAWQIMNGDRKITMIKQDGEMFTAGAIQDFLDWATSVLHEKVKPINGLALVEYIDTFFQFFYIGRVIFDLEIDFVVKFGFVVPEGFEYKLFQPNVDGTGMNQTLGSLAHKEWTMEIKKDDSRQPKQLAAEAIVAIYSSGFGLQGNRFAYLNPVGDSAFEVNEELYTKQQ